jgi:ankyrin repeat protein
MLRVPLILSLSFLFATAAESPDTFQSPLFSAVRNGNSAQLARLLKSGSPVDARDESGATPLMYAAAFGTIDNMQRLMRAGADVNASTREGFTALMWSTGTTEKIKLLIGAGAQVNAAAKSGATALLAAAMRGNLEGVRLLLVSGADPASSMGLIPNAPIRVNLTQIAYTSNDSGLRDLLVQQGMHADLKSITAVPGSSPFSGLFILTGFSMRPSTEPGVAKAVAATLALGAEPNIDVRQLARTVPPLALAAQFGDAEAVRRLLERGADPNRPGTQGVTPLMIAVAAEDPNPAVVHLLLDAGARLETRDALGRTALDWALMQGESSVSAILRERGAASGVWNTPAPRLVTAPRPPREAVMMALKKLQASAVEGHRQTKCISCHGHSLTAVAATVARHHGVTVDTNLTAHPTSATLEMWSPSRDNFLAGNCAVFGFLGNVSYGLFGMAEERVSPNNVTDAATLCLASLQSPDGSWQGGDMRPPLAGRNPFVYTALAVRALNTYMPPVAGNLAQTQIALARRYLSAAVPTDTQGESFKLLGLVWSGASREEVAKQATRLKALQREDGSWSHRGAMPGDAYSTGQALYALHVSGLSARDPIFRRGTAFLLRSQTEDGTWFVRSRALGFQPYMETGFPHGRDQFISAAATAWAAIAVGLTL